MKNYEEQGNGRGSGGIPMNEAHLAAKSPDRFSADPSDKTGLDPFVLREDLRRASVPIDQFGSRRMHGLSFALPVVLPILCAAIYYGLIAAGKYSVEFRFSVRSAAELVADQDNIAPMIKAGKPGTNEIGRLPYMVADYLRSRNVVRELDRDGWLRSVFSRGEADWLSRFDPTKSDDDLWLYWRDLISVNVDRVSGLVLVRVLAFTPDDALALARVTSVSAEKMIDSVAMRERRDALFSADQELERASLRYSAALTALRDVRNQEGTIDPERTIKSSADTLLGVMREKLSLERDRDANLKVLSADAPEQKVLSDQIRALGSQVALLTEALTSNRKNAKTVAQSIAQFEKAELEARFSKRLLEVAQAAYERARQESERQHVYFALFVEPKKPEIAEYPRRARSIAFAGICAFSLWSVMMLAVAGIRDHKIEL
jgi:capsular polysaccharide transport system permease protein